MDLETFKRAIDCIRLVRERDEALRKLHSKYMSKAGVDELANHMESRLVEALSYAVCDTGSWVSYFVYDCDLGADPKEVRIRGRQYKLRTVDMLWKIINLTR